MLPRGPLLGERGRGVWKGVMVEAEAAPSAELLTCTFGWSLGGGRGGSEAVEGSRPPAAASPAEDPSLSWDEDMLALMSWLCEGKGHTQG